MSDKQAITVKHIKVRDLQKDDILILEIDRDLTREEYDQLRVECKAHFPGVKVRILSGGIKLKAILRSKEGGG